jgi:ubiquinone biosynthesis protein
MAVFQRDYRRIAELHVEAGWMPANVRIDELEAATRAVCEPYFSRPLSEISIAEVVVKVFRTAQRYELTLQPQLILLQKTLLNIEGVGRLLDPKLDMFEVAMPVLRDILAERYSPQRLLAELRKRVPEFITHAPEMPRLLREFLVQQVGGTHTLNMRSQELASWRASRATAAPDRVRDPRRRPAGRGRRAVRARSRGPRMLGVHAAVWIAGLGAFGAFLAAWPRRNK